MDMPELKSKLAADLHRAGVTQERAFEITLQTLEAFELGPVDDCAFDSPDVEAVNKGARRRKLLSLGEPPGLVNRFLLLCALSLITDHELDHGIRAEKCMACQDRCGYCETDEYGISEAPLHVGGAPSFVIGMPANGLRESVLLGRRLAGKPETWRPTQAELTDMRLQAIRTGGARALGEETDEMLAFIRQCTKMQIAWEAECRGGMRRLPAS